MSNRSMNFAFLSQEVNISDNIFQRISQYFFFLNLVTLSVVIVFTSLHHTGFSSFNSFVGNLGCIGQSTASKSQEVILSLYSAPADTPAALGSSSGQDTWTYWSPMECHEDNQEIEESRLRGKGETSGTVQPGESFVLFQKSHYTCNMKYLLSHANESYGENEALLDITGNVQCSKIVQLTFR